MKTAIAWHYRIAISLAPKRGYASCESKKCLPKGRQRAFHLLFKFSRIEKVLEAPRAGGPVRVGLCRDSAPVAEISGLRVNYEKSEALWIGSLRLQKRRMEINKNIVWPFCKVNALGVWFSTIKEESLMLNFQEKKEKISKIIENWQFRRFTLPGKVTVI